MKILRAEIKDTDIFSESELDFGACCFFTEDRIYKYFFEIKGQEATLFANTKQYEDEAIEEFLFYSSFIISVKDKDGRVLFTREQNQPICSISRKYNQANFILTKKS